MYAGYQEAASKFELLDMKRLGSVKARAAKAGLVLLSAVIQLCQKHLLPDCTIQSLEAITTASHAFETAPSVAIAAPTVAHNTAHEEDIGGYMPKHKTQAKQLLPVHLPACDLDVGERHSRYGLRDHMPAMLTEGPLATQLRAMQTWCMTTVQLDRKGRAISMRTWQNICEGISNFMGYLHKHGHVTQPLLHNFMTPLHYAAFMSFLRWRGTSAVHQQQQIGVARKVVEFMCSQGQDSLGNQQQRGSMLEWLSRLNKQLGKGTCAGKRDIGMLQEQGKWVHARQYLQLVEQAKQLAMQHITNMGEGAVTMGAARAVHDAALLSCMLGHLPPVRIYVLRTSVTPDYEGKCLEEGCVHGGQCHGNKVSWVDAQDKAALRVHWPHHKNNSRWGKAIAINLPASLNVMLVPYLKVFHGLLTTGPYVFVDMQGNPFTATSFGSYFNKALQQLQPGFPQVPPSLLRHVFVDERMSLDRVNGPTDRGAAHVMGNSTQQWAHSYDLAFDSREAQAAVDSMDVWRGGLMSNSTTDMRITVHNPAPSPDSEVEEGEVMAE